MELLSREATLKVSSPQQRFTTEFGMDRRGSIVPFTPETSHPQDCINNNNNFFNTCSQALGQLVRLGYILYRTYT